MARGLFKETIKFEGRRYEVTASSEELLKEKVYRKRKELESRLTVKRITVNEWSSEWLECYKKDQVCNEYYIDIKRIYKNQIGPVIGEMLVSDVKPVHIQKIANDLEKYSVYYRNQIMCIVREMFYAAIDNGLIPSNPAVRVKMKNRKEPDHRRAITETERFFILKACDNHWGGLFVKIMLFCGLRPGEVAALTWGDVDIDNKVIHVTKARKSDDYIGPPKTSSGIRKVIIPDEFAEELSEHSLGKKKKDLVCLSLKGKPMRANNIQRMWASFRLEMQRQMGGKTDKNEMIPPVLVAPDLTLYCLRHTFCTDLQSAGVPLNVAKVFMGHANIHVTADIYTHTKETDIYSAKKMYDDYVNERSPADLLRTKSCGC